MLKKGATWKSTDGIWKYKIISLNGTLSIPSGSYKDLLEIYAIQLKGKEWDRPRKFHLFFKNQVGLIALKAKGRLNFYRVEEKYN